MAGPDWMLTTTKRDNDCDNKWLEIRCYIADKKARQYMVEPVQQGRRYVEEYNNSM